MAAQSRNSGDSSIKGEFQNEGVESERRNRILSSKLYFDVPASKIRQSGPRPDPRLLRQTALEVLTRSARSDSPRKTRPEQIPAKLAAAA
ncbi:hypothetical protein F511_06894 [Dorcoceras hygrometricum]|uniref:Uncharacterized protein n=1 Tax=Dorcoceras hygrometricum TaxID=472368 RepID=A0A2Z7CXY9_9LAMI|nr:hypothetical protein F511_06894 [Dorcoceras hygrometricum]